MRSVLTAGIVALVWLASAAGVGAAVRVTARSGATRVTGRAGATSVTARAGVTGATGATSSSLLLPLTKAAAPIPIGTALWYACTEPNFSGPLNLRCPLPYNPRYLETFLANFSRFTPENEFKMMFLEPVENRFYFKVADQVARFAQEYHKTIRGHTLIWGQENPLWLSHPLLPWNKSALIGEMHYYIATVVEHFESLFPGVVTEWDVVNEPLTATGALNANPWERVIGPSYVRLALEYAHQANPSARLLINSNGVDHPGPAETGLLELATALKQAGAPLNAVGFEAHVTPDTAPTLSQLLTLWHQYAAAGLDVEVTELDVGNDPGGDTQAQKTAVFETYATACRLAGNCTGLTVWGVANPYSWLGPNTNALLFNSDFQPLPALAFIDKILSGQPIAQTPSTDSNGPATTLGTAVRVVRTLPSAKRHT